MKTLEQLLAEWEEGALTAEGAAELKQLLAAPEARTALVDDWLLHEAVYGKLRAEDTESAVAKAGWSGRAVRPAATRAEPGWLRRVMPRLVWRNVHLSLRWSLGGALAAGLLVLGLWYYFAGGPVARVAELSGDATVERHGRKLPLQNGQLLFAGDRVRVPAGGGALLVWKAEATQFGLDGGTELGILSQVRGRQFAMLAGRVHAVVAPQPPRRPMTLTTPQAEARVVGTRFTLDAAATATRLEVTEGAVRLHATDQAAAPQTKTLTVRAGEFAVASPGTPLQAQAMTGCGMYELVVFPADTPLFDSPGGAVAWGDLLTNLIFFANSVQFARSPTNRYEHRIRCYVHPPATGDYTFWIRSGGHSALWLSSDDDPAHRARIASVSPLTGPGSATPAGKGEFAWRFGTASATDPASVTLPNGVPVGADFSRQMMQKSVPWRLIAGQRYYLEVRLEHDPNDFVEVDWSKPGEPANKPPEFLGGAVLSPFFEPPARLAADHNRSP